MSEINWLHLAPRTVLVMGHSPDCRFSFASDLNEYLSRNPVIAKMLRDERYTFQALKIAAHCNKGFAVKAYDDTGSKWLMAVHRKTPDMKSLRDFQGMVDYGPNTRNMMQPWFDRMGPK